MLKKLLRTDSRFSAAPRQALYGDDWGFTYIGGSLEREALPTYQEGHALQANSPESSAFPLSKAPIDDRLYVSALQGDRATVHYLQQLGFSCGSEVQVISRRGSGSVILTVGGTRLGLGAAMARRIMVSGAGGTTASRQLT
ncbi:MAG: ferrous iron transport protein A [Elainellaceae cyanobacterium]